MTQPSSLVAAFAAFVHALHTGRGDVESLSRHLTWLASGAVPTSADDRKSAIEECVSAVIGKLFRMHREGELATQLGLRAGELHNYLEAMLRTAHVDLDPNKAPRHALAQHVRALLLQPLDLEATEPLSITDAHGRFSRPLIADAMGALFAREPSLEREATPVVSALCSRFQVGIHAAWSGHGTNEDEEFGGVEELDGGVAGWADPHEGFAPDEALAWKRFGEELYEVLGDVRWQMLAASHAGVSIRQLAARLARPHTTVHAELQHATAVMQRLLLEHELAA